MTNKGEINMLKFRTKPVVIEAIQWFKNGDHPKDHEPIGEVPLSKAALEKYVEDIQAEGKIVRYYRRPDVDGHTKCKKCGKIMHLHGWIDTREGGHIVCPGDFILIDVQGEYYPIKPDIFGAIYEPEINKGVDTHRYTPIQ